MTDSSASASALELFFGAHFVRRILHISSSGGVNSLKHISTLAFGRILDCYSVKETKSYVYFGNLRTWWMTRRRTMRKEEFLPAKEAFDSKLWAESGYFSHVQNFTDRVKRGQRSHRGNKPAHLTVSRVVRFRFEKCIPLPKSKKLKHRCRPTIE